MSFVLKKVLNSQKGVARKTWKMMRAAVGFLQALKWQQSHFEQFFREQIQIRLSQALNCRKKTTCKQQF